jgi:hypothetical protein
VSGTKDTAKVELAYPATVDGKDYAPDDVVELDRVEARQYVQEGRARWHDQVDKDTDGRPIKSAAKKATASSRATAAGATKGDVTSG